MEIEKLCNRLDELSDAVTKGVDGNEEFSMRIPADPKRDADLVLSSAAKTIRKFAEENEELKKARFEPILVEISKLRLSPSDVLIVNVKQKLCDRDAAELEKCFRDLLPRQVYVVSAIGIDMNLTVVDAPPDDGSFFSPELSRIIHSRVG